MDYGKVGRRLGIAVRVAGKLLGQQAERNARRGAPIYPIAAAASVTRTRARATGKGFARGSSGFWANSVGPFARVGKALWFEITGLFFALFALFFAQNVYRLRADYAHGAEHRHFAVYCALLALFAYFSASSFLRARRISRGKR